MALFGVTLALFLASYLQQSQAQGLSCWTCLFNPKDNTANVFGFNENCPNLALDTAGKISKTDCKATEKYCEKKYLKVVYEDTPPTEEEYLVRGCSPETQDFGGDVPDGVCMDLIPKKSSTTITVGPSKLEEYLSEVEKTKAGKPPPSVNYTQTGRACFCSKNECNKGDGLNITAEDGAERTSAAPPPVDPNPGPGPEPELRSSGAAGMSSLAFLFGHPLYSLIVYTISSYLICRPFLTFTPN